MRSMVTSCFQCYEGLHKARALDLWGAAWSSVIRDSSLAVRVRETLQWEFIKFPVPKVLSKCAKV